MYSYRKVKMEKWAKKKDQREIKIRKSARIRDFLSFYTNADWRKGTRNEYKSGTFLTQQSWVLKGDQSSQTHVFALSFDTLIFKHDIKIENSHQICDIKQNTSLNSAC